MSEPTKVAEDEVQRLQAIVATLTAACEDGRDYCEAMENQGPAPFNRTPLKRIQAAIRTARRAT